MKLRGTREDDRRYLSHRSEYNNTSDGGSEYITRQADYRGQSEELRDRIIASLSRYADKHRIDIDTAAYRQISEGRM